MGPTCSFSGIYIGAGMLLANRATSDITKADCVGAKVCEPVKSVPQLPEGSRQVTLLETNSEFIPENSMVGRWMKYFQG